MNLRRLFKALLRTITRLLEGFQGSKNSSQKLAKTCKTLQQQLSSVEDREKAWETYGKALTLARECGREELIEVIRQFDSAIGEQTPHSSIFVGKTLSALLEEKNQTTQSLDTAWRFAQRLDEPSSIKDVQQQICIQLARVGEPNALLGKLLKMQNESVLTSANLTEILNAFLKKNSFDSILPWESFFRQLQESQLPRIHQVYAILGRNEIAAELAETDGDYRNAMRYLMLVPGKKSALHALALANQLNDEPAIAQANQRIAECFWAEENYTAALEHFKASGDLAQVSNCHQKLGQLGLAIQLHPSIDAQWRQNLRIDLENAVKVHLDRKDFLPTALLMKTVEDAWRQKAQDSDAQQEADRLQHLLSGVVRTARVSFESELRTSEDALKTDVFKRWSLLEEAAGNYLEAGLQAEKAQDFFAASLLFEKAEAFGQALSALDSAAPDSVNPMKKAQLLEQGGDFFMAALLYERLNEIDLAIAMYEQAREFTRAAELRQQQMGDAQAVFDDRFKDLLAKAGRVEQLAELCAARANDERRSPNEKAKLWRRVKALAEQGLVGQKWLDRATAELPNIEALDRSRFDQNAPRWVQRASQEILAEYTDAIGLDLGTSNSVVCLYNKAIGKPEVVEWKGQRQIPSVFAIDQLGQELVGIPILDLLLKSPRAIITRAKREMGTDRKFRAGGQDYRAEEISARIINRARQFARDYLQKKIAEKVLTIASGIMGSTPPNDWVNEFLEKKPPIIPLSNIVITVPAYFNEAQKQATKTAGTLAGIYVLRLIHEPTAACLAQRIQENNAETILVADLGAGTFDLSILEAGQGIFEVLEIEGDNALGSADLDELIYTHFSEIIKAETGEEIPRNGQTATRLRQACEELKIELSSRSEWTIDLPYLIGDRTIQLHLTREELEHLASSWLERIRTACQNIRRKPSRVLLIGGGGLMPAVHRCIRDVFKLEPDSAYDPLTVVARGAALQAASLVGDAQDILLLDATPFSLGIKCQTAPGEFKFDPVIPKHQTIPAEKTHQYTTTEDGQTEVSIEIFQGESSVPEKNFKVGQFILKGIPATKAGVPKIDVKFDIDLNCLLIVTACDAVTGNQKSITISDSHLLTPAQAASLQVKFQTSQAQQILLTRLEKLAIDLKAQLYEIEKVELSTLLTRLQTQIQSYERYRERYSPTALDEQILIEIYHDQNEWEKKARLSLDQWGTLGRSVRIWLDAHQNLDRRSATTENLVQQLVDEGDLLLRRTSDAGADTAEVSMTYQRWLNVVENLPINPEGNAEEIARHFLNLRRYSEALTQFQRMETPLSLAQAELGLEILARSRQREDYVAMLLEYANSLEVHCPDFERLNHSVRIYAASIVWIQVSLGDASASGSGFAISPNQIATNRHVLMDDTTGDCVLPENLQVITDQGALQVLSIHLPSWGADDVAILQVQPDSAPLMPLRLGFSELVEVGERIMTIGFPAPEREGFQENLYCNTGLVNRIRQSQFCTERVLEVSIPLQGGISGAPIFNQLGEVIGLLTFYTERRQESATGQARSEQSFYSIPVELLHRLQKEVSRD
jgi:molecular chaperone DnaK